MSLIPERLRPYVAGLLGTIATGFGHFYLRRWLRGLGWIALAFAVTVAFVPLETLEAMGESGVVGEQADLYPAMIVQLAGAFDAFLLEFWSSSSDESGDAPATAAVDADAAAADTVACPNCGKEVDADLDFCHWCTTEFVTPERDADAN